MLQLEHSFYGVEIWTLRKADPKCLESFGTWCWRRMDKNSWADCMRNEKLLLRARKDRNIIHRIQRRKGKSIGHIFRRNCLLKHVIKWKIKESLEVAGRRGKRRKQLLYVLKEIEIGSTISQSMENSLWKRIWTYRDTDYGKSEFSVAVTIVITRPRLQKLGASLVPSLTWLCTKWMTAKLFNCKKLFYYLLPVAFCIFYTFRCVSNVCKATQYIRKLFLPNKRNVIQIKLHVWN